MIFKRGLYVFILCGLILPSIQAEETISKITIGQFVDLALTRSDDFKVAVNNYNNSVNSYKVSYRSSRLPQASVNSSVGKTRSDANSIVTETETSDGTVTLSQPFYPTGASLSGSVTESTSKSESLGVISRSDVKPNYSASITQPIFLFVGNQEWRTWKRSKISYSIAEDTFKRSLQQIRNQARQFYYNILLRQRQLEVEEFKLKSSERAHKITKALVKAGRYAGVELNRSNIRLQRDGRRLKNAQTTLNTTINDALTFVSLDINKKYEFTSKLDYEKVKLPLERLIQFAFLHRPDYRAAKQQLELSKIDLKQAKEADNPDLNATASISRNESETLNSNSVTKAWTGKLNLTWNIFDSRITKLNIKSAKNNLENQAIDFAGLKRDIETDVTNAFLDVKRAEEQIDDLIESRKQARKAVKVVQTRYKNGIDRLVDVFDSENELRDVELEYLDALISANRAVENLELLIGGSMGEVLLP